MIMRPSDLTHDDIMSALVYNLFVGIVHQDVGGDGVFKIALERIRVT